MEKFFGLLVGGAILALGMQCGVPPAQAQTAAKPAMKQAAVKTPAIPKGKENDVKFYAANGGKPVTGADAFAQMPKAGLVLWLAGNQFFAMDDVIGVYQKQHAGVSVGLITLPPGLLLQAINAGGWTYAGKDFRGLPDVYASVNLGHLKKLKASGKMDSYMIYMHNELQIMVAKGNPKKVVGVKDLARADVRTSMPNPINEGIMQFYIRKVLERHGIWQTISAGKTCVHCQVTPNSWFTAVHHRETPDRITAGQSDAGMVWKTEVLAALRSKAPVEGITLNDQDSLRNEVSYAIGMLKASPRQAAAESFLAFLRSPECQSTYAKYGFVNATADELKPKPIN
jgi:ABC-type molybdate transport system substrate-binding protein